MFLNQTFVGVKFVTVADPNTEYTCQGYDNNGTLLIIGSKFDSVNNRTILKTFKLTDVVFLGKV